MRERLLRFQLSFFLTVACLFLQTQPAQAKMTCRAVFERTFAVGKLKPYFKHNNKYSSQISEKTAIKNQCALGTCHLHAWASSMEKGHLKRTGEEIKISMPYLAVSHWIDKAVQAAMSKVDYEAANKRLVVSLGATIGGSREAIQKFGIIPDSVWSPKTKFELAPAADRVEESVVNLIGKAKWEIAREISESKKAAIMEKINSDLNSLFDEIAGEIPNSFVYKGKTYTPQEFAREKFPEIFEPIVHVSVNLGRKERTHRALIKGNHQIETSIEIVESLTRAAIDAGEPVVLTYEHNSNYVDKKTGIMSIGAFNLPNNGGPMTRKQRAAFGTSDGGHAVQLIGYDLDPTSGRVVKWKIQNSWGKKSGDKGIYHMYTDYFRAFAKSVSFSAAAKVDLPSNEIKTEHQYGLPL